MKELLIARREPREHLNGAPGEWWAEYRLVRAEGAEPHFEGSLGMSLPYAMQIRYCHEVDSEYCHAPTHDGTWKPYRGCATALEAIQDLGDTGWREATSLHPAHALALTLLDLKGRLRELEVGCSDKAREEHENELKLEAEALYHQALKRRRIYSAATRGEAPEHKVQACRDEAMAWLKAQKAQLHNNLVATAALAKGYASQVAATELELEAALREEGF